MAWRKTIPHIGEAVFPGELEKDNLEVCLVLISSAGSPYDVTLKIGISSPQRTYGTSNRQPSLASLPLQVAIYYNLCFFPVWLITTIVMMTVKVHCLTNLYRLIAVTVFVSVTCIEVLRLYLGYFGNLSEKIPEVAAFWMLSVLLQFPLQTFLTASKELRQSVIEYTVQGVMLVLLCAQLVLGFIALRSASRTQAKRFHMALMINTASAATKE